MKRVLALAGLVLAVGCGSAPDGAGVATLSGSDGSTPSATPAAKVDREDAFREFARCMRENGVDMPDPDKSGKAGKTEGRAFVVAPSAAPQRMEKAEKACAHHLENAVGDAPKGNDPAMLDRALKFARCMRENGIDMPDPSSDGAIRKERNGAGNARAPFNARDPKFEAAQKVCGELLGNTPGGQPGISVRKGGS